MKPLNIKSLTQVKEGMLTTYKPAYDTETAFNALETTGMFEGSISLLALDPEPVQGSDAAAIAGSSAVSWKATERLAVLFDVVQACVGVDGEKAQADSADGFPCHDSCDVEKRRGFVDGSEADSDWT